MNFMSRKNVLDIYNAKLPGTYHKLPMRQWHKATRLMYGSLLLGKDWLKLRMVSEEDCKLLLSLFGQSRNRFYYYY